MGLRYFDEIRVAWRPLLAAMLGLATGNSIVGVVTSAIAPSLIADAGWQKSDFALVGSLSLPMAFLLPFIGRLADVLGVRLTALIGLVTVPLVYWGFSLNGGSLAIYMAVFLVQTTVCVTTTAMVYTRLVVQHVQQARGLALALVTASPAVAGIVIGPILNGYVEAHGWQAAYRALAFCACISGVVVFLLIPPDRVKAAKQAKAGQARFTAAYREIFASRAFWILAISMLLCNLPQTLLLTQLKLLVMDKGVSGEGAAVMLSAMSFGMLAGRLATGLALDRFRPHWVAFVALGVPTLGLFFMASPLNSHAMIMASVAFLGFAFGAEGDAVAFLVARHFRVGVYSSVMGLMTAVMSFSSAAGAAILSLVLARSNSFDPFLVGTGVAVALGALLLLRLGGCPTAGAPHHLAPAEAQH